MRLPKTKAKATTAATATMSTAASGQPVTRDKFPPLSAPPLVIDGVGGRHVDFCAGGKHLLIWGGDCDLFAYDVASRTRLWHLNKCQAMAVSLDGEVVATLDIPKAHVLANRLVLRTGATGKPLHPKPWQGAADLSLVTYTAGNQIVVATSDGALHVLDGATQQEVANPASVANLRSCGVLGTTPVFWAHVQAYDAGSMALCGPSAIQRINTANGQVTATWAGASQALASADGRLLALLFLGKKPVVRVVSLETEAVKYVLTLRGTKPGNDPMYGFHLVPRVSDFDRLK